MKDFNIDLRKEYNPAEVTGTGEGYFITNVDGNIITQDQDGIDILKGMADQTPDNGKPFHSHLTLSKFIQLPEPIVFNNQRNSEI